MTNIEKLEKQIEELKAEIEKLKKSEKQLERPDHFYFINMDGDGDFYIDKSLCDNDYYFNNRNYFLSEKSAERFLSAVEELKALQYYHEIYCPDYIPNWNDEKEEKWYVFFNKSLCRYQYSYSTNRYRLNEIYFDSEETVKKVCNRLNKNL